MAPRRPVPRPAAILLPGPAHRPPHLEGETPQGRSAAAATACARPGVPRRTSTAEHVLAEPVTPHGALVDDDPEPWPFGRRDPAAGVPDRIPDQLMLHRRAHR